MAPKTAGIVVIGDEILAGKFADENAKFLIGELRELGVSLQRIAVIPDDLADISTTVRSFSERFDFVFTSGGVGPTHDDLTIEGIARAFGAGVVVNPTMESVLRAFWGDGMPEANIRLAQTPEGAELVYGGTGRTAKWPVVKYRNIYILPGVPKLFRSKFEGIKERFRGNTKYEARLYCTGDEGALAPELTAVDTQFPTVQIGSYPRFEETRFKVIVTFECDEQDALDRAVDAVRERLKDNIVEID